MEGSHGQGYFHIPKRLNSGIYYIRAYTNYMKNYGYNQFAYTSVNILNPFIPAGESDSDHSMSSTLQNLSIHPEGGIIVPDYPNIMVAELSDNSGKPVPGIGRLLDDKDSIIAKFVTSEYGIGSFSFNPLPGISYRVEAAAGAEIIEQRIEIPVKAIRTGPAIRINQGLQFEIQKYNFSDFPVNVILRYQGSVFKIAELKETDSVIFIPAQELPAGIARISFTNTEGRLLSQRNFFNPVSKKSDLIIACDKAVYRNRETVELMIEKNPEDKSENWVSLSVFLVQKNNLQKYFDHDRQRSLASALYSFTGGSPYPVHEILADSFFLDQILTIQDYSSSNDSLLELKYEELFYFPEMEYDLITGEVTDEQGKSGVSASLIQTWVDTVSTMQTTMTNDKGIFFFATDRQDHQELVIAHSKYSTGKIQVREEFYPAYFSMAREHLVIDPVNRETYRQQMLNVQINDSYSSSQAKQTDGYQLPFYVKPDRLFLIDDYVPLPTLGEFLFEVVPDMLPYRSKGKYVIRMPFPPDVTMYGNDPLFLVDGVPLFDADQVARLNCSEIYSVGIIYEKYFYQQETFDGILDIRTRRGDASMITLPEDTYSGHFTGIQSANPLDKPILKDKHPRIPCFKTQLYWKPWINLDRERVSVILITPDNTGDYLVRCTLKKTDGSVEYFYTTFRVEGE
jgi:hypothetical protein